MRRCIETLDQNKLEIAIASVLLAGKFHFYSSRELETRTGDKLGSEWPRIDERALINGFTSDLQTIAQGNLRITEEYLKQVEHILNSTGILGGMNGANSDLALIGGDLHPENIIISIPRKQRDAFSRDLVNRTIPSKEILYHLRITDLGKSKIGNRIIDLVDIINFPNFEIVSYDDKIGIIVKAYADLFASYSHRIATGDEISYLRERVLSISPIRCIRSAANVSGELKDRYLAQANSIMRRNSKYTPLVDLLSKEFQHFQKN